MCLPMWGKPSAQGLVNKGLCRLVLTSSLPLPGTASVQCCWPPARMEPLQKPMLSRCTESTTVFLPSARSHRHSLRSRP